MGARGVDLFGEGLCGRGDEAADQSGYDALEEGLLRYLFYCFRHFGSCYFLFCWDAEIWFGGQEECLIG
jgi:hypothetical protein